MTDNDHDDDFIGQAELEAMREIDQEVGARLVALELLGVTFQTDMPQVERVPRGSTAEHAGLKVGDIIIGVDGSPTPKTDDLIAAIGRCRPSPVIHFTVQRNGATLAINAAPDPSQQRPTPKSNHLGRVEHVEL